LLTKRAADNMLRYYGGANRRLGRLARRPILYFLYITRRCNLNCTYCWQRVPPPAGDRGELPADELSADEWCRVVEQIPRPAAVGFSGGEPLLVQGFDEIFRRAASRNAVTINTNGVLLTEQLCELFVSHGLRNLSVSLDGFSDVHDTARGSPGLFEKIVSNISTLNGIRNRRAGRKPSLTIKATLLNEGMDGLEKFCEYCRNELQAQTVNISLAKTENHAQFSHRLYSGLGDLRTAGLPRSIPYSSPEKVVRTLTKLLADYSRGPMRVTLYPLMRTPRQIADYLGADGMNVFRRCSLPWSMAVIMPGGDVIPCLSLRLGNVRETGYDVRKIIAGQASQDFRKALGQLQRGAQTPDVCNCCCFLSVK